MVYVVFAGMALITIYVAVKLSRYADVISHKTAFGGMLIGSLLLAVATSLPEVTTSATSIIIANPDLAVGNLLGSNMMNMLIIAGFDLYFRRQQIFQQAAYQLQYYAILGIMLTVLVWFGMFLPGYTILGIGLETYLLLLLYGCGMWYIARKKPADSKVLSVAKQDDDLNQPEKVSLAVAGAGESNAASIARGNSNPQARISVKRAIIGFAISSLVILISGSVLTISGDRIAEMTGLGSSFVGSFLIAASTSLPEAVSVYVALLLSNYRLAIGSVLSSNLFNLLILSGTDIFFQEGNLLTAAESTHRITAGAGMVLTAMVFYSLRRKKTTLKRYLLPSASMIVFYFVFSYWMFIAS